MLQPDHDLPEVKLYRRLEGSGIQRCGLKASSGAHGGQALPQAGVEHEVERGEGGVGGHGGQQAAVQAREALIARDGRQR